MSDPSDIPAAFVRRTRKIRRSNISSQASGNRLTPDHIFIKTSVNGSDWHVQQHYNPTKQLKLNSS